MLFRLVQPVKRSGSSKGQLQKRIPRDLRDRMAGMTLAIPIGESVAHVVVPLRAESIRCSLRTSDPSETKIRHATAVAYLEAIFKALRDDVPVSLTRAQSVALSRDLYEGWVEGANRRAERTTAMVHTPDGWVRDYGHLEEEAEAFAAMVARFDTQRTEGTLEDLERTFGPIIDKLATKRGVPVVDAQSRRYLLDAFLEAARDAMAARERQARSDFSPDPRAARFPAWEAPTSPQSSPSTAKVSLKGLVEAWWTEAKATGRKPSTHESYSNSMAAFVDFLKHDDASRVTPEDVIGFKNHRLATINPRTGKPISPKTVKDSDLAGLKSVFDWAVINRKMASNPALGVTVKLVKAPKLRSKGFTDAEAKAILSVALHLTQGRERPETWAAKRWIPWISAYTGARVGEIAQLRKQDVRREGEHWTITITPEAGTVKTNEARTIPLHHHLVEQGFHEFARKASEGHLFLRPAEDGDVLGPLQGVKNRLGEFSRKAIPGAAVAPTHGWRHRFKTIGREAEIDQRILDAIQGHSAKTQGESYGDVTLKAMAAAMAKIPRYKV